MASQWFYKVTGKQVGPVSSADLLALAQRGTVTYDTPVRKGPDATWVSAKRAVRTAEEAAAASETLSPAEIGHAMLAEIQAAVKV